MILFYILIPVATTEYLGLIGNIQQNYTINHRLYCKVLPKLQITKYFSLTLTFKETLLAIFFLNLLIISDLVSNLPLSF